MQENTNKSIAVNSLILYIRLAIISISGLLYTRFSLQALGISDYGLYSVIACIITPTVSLPLPSASTIRRRRAVSSM